jgi:hypothetical protein
MGEVWHHASMASSHLITFYPLVCEGRADCGSGGIVRNQ